MFLQKLTNVLNVGASQVASIPNLPLGMTYYGLILKLGGTTFNASHINSVKCRLAGKLFIDITGSHLDSLTQYLKLEKDAAYLPLFFAEPNAKTVVGEYAGAIDTSVYDALTAFSIEVDIGAATAPTLEIWAMLAPPKAENDANKRTIRALLKAEHAPASAAEHTLAVPLGSINGAQLKRICAFHGGNVTKLQVKKDSLDLIEEGEIALLSYLQDTYWREEQANLEVADFVISNNMSDVVPSLRRNGQAAVFQVKATTSAADTITTYSDIFTTIDRV